MIDDAEHRGSGADSQSQSRHAGDDECVIFAKGAKTERQILPEPTHARSD